MEKQIKRSEIEELKRIQFGIDAQYREPGEQYAYLESLGYTKEQADEILAIVYWGNDEENPRANEDALLDAGWGIGLSDGAVIMKCLSLGSIDTVVPSINAMYESATNCMCCGEEINLGFGEHHIGSQLCDKCKAAIKAMRKFLPEDKEILTPSEAGEDKEGDITISIVPPAGIPASEYHSWYQSSCNIAKITFEQLSCAMQTHPYVDRFIIRKKV